MTVKEMFESKYTAYMANITKRMWENHKAYAEARKIPVYKQIIMSLEITENDCNPRVNADAYWELIEMNKSKLVASNRHRQYHGKTDRFWLTEKGYKQLFAQ